MNTAAPHALKKRLLTLALSLAFLLTCLPAALAVDLNVDAGFYFKQSRGGTCTLASAAMMLRRRAYFDGLSDWTNVTENSVRSTAWANGLAHSFTYKEMQVGYGTLPSRKQEKVQTLITLLSQHPEGIVLYDRTHREALFYRPRRWAIVPLGGFRAAAPGRDLSPEEARQRVEAGEPYVIRQRIPHEGTTTFHDVSFGDITVENKTLDDQVLIKRDGLPTYNFANVIDDHLMGITHVVRGSEYLSSTPKYNLLYEGFGWEIPKYIHCSPVMRDQHNKMSKRHGDPSYEDLKAQGYLTEAILNYVALLGWAPKGERSEQEIFSLSELVEAFDIAGISKSPAIFDIDKLTYFNATYLRAMAPEDFAKAAEPYIREAVKNPAIDVSAVAALLQARCEKLTEIPEKVDFFDALPEYDIALYTNKKSKTDPDVSLEMLKTVRPLLAELPAWDDETLLAAMKDLAERLEVKNAKVRWPVRIAVSGRAVTPGGAVEICRILGRDETLRRIDAGIAKLEG